jgi:hypothetical protein
MELGDFGLRISDCGFEKHRVWSQKSADRGWQKMIHEISGLECWVDFKIAD